MKDKNKNIMINKTKECVLVKQFPFTKIKIWTRTHANTYVYLRFNNSVTNELAQIIHIYTLCLILHIKTNFIIKLSTRKIFHIPLYSRQIFFIIFFLISFSFFFSTKNLATEKMINSYFR